MFKIDCGYGHTTLYIVRIIELYKLVNLNKADIYYIYHISVISTMEKCKVGREDNKAGTEDWNFVFFFSFWLYCVACGILVP